MKTITGQFFDKTGSPAAGATLTLTLSADAVALGVAQITTAAQHISLDDTGSIPASTQIWAIDELTTDSPESLFYYATVTKNRLGVIYDEQLNIRGTSPIDLNSL